jgi:hypothetical protein
MKPIIPIVRQELFDDSAYLFELKFDGFRGIANTVRGWMLSKNGNRRACPRGSPWPWEPPHARLRLVTR